MWLTDTMESSIGIFLLDSLEWSPNDTDLTIYCNACIHGLGFYAPPHNVACYAEFTDILSLCSIFCYKALCVVSAIVWAIQMRIGPHRLLIFTDSMNTVEMFHSLSGQSSYIDLLLHAICLLNPTTTSLPAFHIYGSDNTIIYTISHGLFSVALPLQPGSTISLFQPPFELLGAST